MTLAVGDGEMNAMVTSTDNGVTIVGTLDHSNPEKHAA